MAHTKLKTFHLFAGAGGGILADLLLDHIPVGACEIEQYPRDVLLARQRDGILPAFPIWDDICTLDGKPWRGLVDVVCGGFPCQDISAAGKGAGISGERSGLWGEMARVIREIRPRYAFVENSPMLTSRGLGTVLGDLAAMGYDARWCVLGACDAGAPHKRDRIWILGELADSALHGQSATKEREGIDQRGDKCEAGKKSPSKSARLRASTATENLGNAKCAAQLSDASSQGLQGREQPRALRDERNGTQAHGSTTECNSAPGFAGWWDIDPAECSDSSSEGLERQERQEYKGDGDGRSELCIPEGRKGPAKPLVGRVANGLANILDGNETPFAGRVPRVATGVTDRVSRLKAIGNGQVPQCAALAFSILSEGLV